MTLTHLAGNAFCGPLVLTLLLATLLVVADPDRHAHHVAAQDADAGVDLPGAGPDEASNPSAAASASSPDRGHSAPPSKSLSTDSLTCADAFSSFASLLDDE